jgi:hypothetical protein
MVDREKKLRFVSIIINFYLFLSALIFVVYLIAPLLGGKLFFNALVVYGSWIGMALMLKYILKKAQEKIRLKWFEFLFLTTYGITCMLLWFTYPYNILFCLLIVVGNLIGYRAQMKSFNS